MLKDRTIELKFNDYILDTFTLNNRIGQDDPLLIALYQFYNANILNISRDKNESVIAYVDNAILTVIADTFQQAHQKLLDIIT